MVVARSIHRLAVVVVTDMDMWAFLQHLFRRGPDSPVGRPLLPAAELSYEMARVTRPLDGWLTAAASASAATSRDLTRLQQRARDLAENDPYCARAITEWTAAIVGDGITVAARTDDASANARARDAWSIWSAECDLEGAGRPWLALQRLAVATMIRDGEVLVRRVVDSSPIRGHVPLRLAVLECDRLSRYASPVSGSGGQVIDGVEYDARGRRVAYHILAYHPGGSDPGAPSPARATERVPAGEIIHLFDTARPGAVRGVPWAAPVGVRHRLLADYEEAELTRKRTESLVVGIARSSAPGASQLLGPTVSRSEVQSDGTTVSRQVADLEPGMIVSATETEGIEWLQPTSIGGYDANIRQDLRAIAAGWRLPYELLTGDMSSVNFSSARFGLQGFRRLTRQIQEQVVIPILCARVWQWWVDLAELSGVLPRRSAGWPARWSPPLLEEVDRLRDAQAAAAEIRSGLATLGQSLERRGLDLDEQIGEMAAERSALAAAGVELDSISAPVSAE